MIEGISPVPRERFDVPAPDSRWVEESLSHQSQQREHKKCLFCALLWVSFAMLFLFVILIAFCDRTILLLSKTPFAVLPLSLMGLIRTVLLVALAKGVFGHTPKQEVSPDSAVSTIIKLVEFIKGY